MAAEDLLRGPVRVMLAKAQDTVPDSTALPGGAVWELKFDGCRAVLRITEAGAELWSRNGSDLSRVFPDLITAAAGQLPVGTLADGEAVVYVDGRLSFDHLQHRMVSAPPAATRLARQYPATYVGFDLLAAAGEDLRLRPWRERRATLEAVWAGCHPPLELSPYTADRATALEWLRDHPEATGIEGLVAKGTGSTYRPGVRGWIKIKSRHSLDTVVGAVIGPVERPEAVVAGRYTETGELQMVGRSGPLTPRQAADLAAVLELAGGASLADRDRFGSFRWRHGHVDSGGADSRG